MRQIIISVVLLTVLMVLAVPGHATVYLNRKLIECDPLTYTVEPLEFVGTGLYLDRDFQNDYGKCVGDPPGPPFILENSVTIENEYNEDGRILNWGSLIIENRYGGGSEPFVIEIRDYTSLNMGGNVVAKGKASDPIIFKTDGSIHSQYYGGPVSIELQEYTLEFEWCEFKAGEFCTDPTMYLNGGHLIMNNCYFGPTIDEHGIWYHSMKGGWSVTMNDCTFSGISHPTVSPNILGVSTVDINNVQFYNCSFPTGPLVIGVLDFYGSPTIKNLNGISGSGNSRNWVVFNLGADVEDSCTIKTSNDFTAFMPERFIVDTNAVCVLEKGTVLEMRSSSSIDVFGKMILDSAVITSYTDGAYGIDLPGWSRDIPYQPNAWYGIDVDALGSIEVKNHSLLHWCQNPIHGAGDVTFDHSTIEQCWGTGINVDAARPTKLEVRGSVLTKGGIEFYLHDHPASGRVIIDSNQITRFGGDGIYIGGGQSWSFDDSLNVQITNNVISGNGGSGIYGYLWEPTDSIVILNNQLIGNGESGLYLADGNGDSVVARLENNVCMGNTKYGISAQAGLVEAVGNTCAYNGQMGLSYPYNAKKLGTVANNIFAYNDRNGLFCYETNDGIVPIIAHNIFWQNYGDGGDQLRIVTDDFTIYTVAELQALGGVGVTNEEFTPAFPPVYRDVIRSHQYDSAMAWTYLCVDGESLVPGQLAGMAILPSHRDTTAWYYVLGNSSDTIYVSRNLTGVVNNSDTLTVFDYHLTPFSPAVDFGNNDYVATEYDIDGDQRILDSDENGSELVDAGADEFNPDTSNIQILVVSPKPDTTLVPGETVLLSWVTAGVATVNIDYSYDIPLGGEPTTWLEVARDVSTTLPLYGWEVPMVQSARCMIRVSDASNPGYNRTSEIFHIKQPRLTRFAADSTYEFFQPSTHGWSFLNSASDMWPQAWWQQYDYMGGTDPYTGNEYPSFDPAYPFGEMSESIYPSWPIFVETFSQAQCYNNTPTGWLYLMRAVNRWADVSHAFNGSCAGVSSSALLAFGSKAELDVNWGYLDLPATIYQKTMTDEVREFINVLQTYVHGKAEQSWVPAHYGASVDSTVGLIRDMLLASSREQDAFLFISDQAATASHAVFPWAVVDDPDPDKVQVNVYDPNEPGNDNLYIEADTVANVWSYSDKPTWGGSRYFFLEYPVRWCLETPELKSLAKQHATSMKGADSTTRIELLFPSDGYVSVYNSAGDSVGIGESGGFNSIDGAALLPPMFGPGGAPYCILLPDQMYTIALSGLVDSSIRAGFYYDSVYVGYGRAGVDSTHTDSLLLNGSLAIHNPDGDAKTVRIRMAQTLPAGERAVVIDSLQITGGGSATLEPLDSTGWYLDNPGEARTYRLWMREVSATGEWTFRAHGIPIEAGIAHLLTPDWSQLNDDSCTIYVDTDGDYLADDSLTLYPDILVDIEDDPADDLPYRFAVSQNYPNPFNPVTTIEYSLPERSHVLIEVYNVLGQKVRSLVDREESAGSYTVSWNGTDASGHSVATGVYLYRFQAGDHIETKKMLLLK